MALVECQEGTEVRTVIERGFFFAIRLDLRRLQSLTLSRQTGESVPGRSHSRHLHKLPPTHTHRDTHTQLEWLSIARHVEQQCSSGWRLRCRKMSSGKRQSRFCPCLCVSQCVCVWVWNAFCAFSISTKFSPGEKATQKAAIRLSRLPIRYDIYTYTIYSYAQYVFRYCFFCVCIALEKRCEATLIVSVG